MNHDERKAFEKLVSEIRWVRQAVHQAHHDGPIEGCPKNTCKAIDAMLVEAGAMLRAPSELRVELNGAHLAADKNSLILDDHETGMIEEFTWPEVWKALWPK